MYTSDNSSAKGDNFCDFLFAFSANQSPEKGASLKRTNLHPFGVKSFHYGKALVRRKSK